MGSQAGQEAGTQEVGGWLTMPPGANLSEKTFSASLKAQTANAASILRRCLIPQPQSRCILDVPFRKVLGGKLDSETYVPDAAAVVGGRTPWRLLGFGHLRNAKTLVASVSGDDGPRNRDEGPGRFQVGRGNLMPRKTKPRTPAKQGWPSPYRTEQGSAAGRLRPSTTTVASRRQPSDDPGGRVLQSWASRPGRIA